MALISEQPFPLASPTLGSNNAPTGHSDVMDEFREAARAERGLIIGDVIGDGKLHRCGIVDKPNGKDGAYKLYLDAFPAGGYQNHADGQGWQNWHTKSKQPSREQYKVLRARQAEDKRVSEAEEAAKHEKAAIECQRILAEAKAADGNDAYSVKKGIRLEANPVHGPRQVGSEVAFGFVNIHGEVRTIEYINGLGKKRWHTGGKKQGHFHPIGELVDGEPICFVEGIATGYTVREATKVTTVVAGDCGNLLPVAKAIRARYPKSRITFCADDDWKREEEKGFNPGIEHAKEAAAAVGGFLATPAFPANRGEKDKDFNDLERVAGADTVRQCIRDAKPVDAPSGAALAEGLATTTPANCQTDIPWLDPEELKTSMPDVETLDVRLLPRDLCDTIIDKAERLDCDPLFIAAPMISAIGAVIGRQAAMRPRQHDSWEVVPIVWSAIVGSPASGKSPAINAATEDVRRLEADEFKRFTEESKDHEFEVMRTETRKEDIERRLKAAVKSGTDDAQLREEFKQLGDAPKHTCRRYITVDSTTEKLGELMAENPNGLITIRDELTGFFREMDRQGHEPDRGFHLVAAEGNQSYTYDRIKRGTVRVEAVTETVTGGIQPGPLSVYLKEAIKGGALADGLMQRFGLMVYPDPPKGFRNVDRAPNKAAKERSFQLFKRLSNISPQEIGAQVEEGKLPYLRFSPEGQKIYDEWVTELMAGLREGNEHPALESHLSKYRRLMPALALILHLADGGVGPVSKKAALMAVSWCELLGSHARRIYACVESERMRVAGILLGRIRQGALPATFTARDVIRKGWTALSTPDDVREAMAILIDHWWIREDLDTQTGGRPKLTYLVHPSLSSVLSVPQGGRLGNFDDATGREEE